MNLFSEKEMHVHDTNSKRKQGKPEKGSLFNS